MRRPVPRVRSGITLVEILISILIMGVGLISLATLFPLGLLRLRDAARLTRSAFMSEAARSDVEARNLFNKASFLNSNICPWYFYNKTTHYDPWIQDTVGPTTYNPTGAVFRGYGIDGAAPNATAYNTAIGAGQLYPIYGAGLPVAYDPLWWSEVGSLLGVQPNNSTFEGRFGIIPWQASTAVSGLPRITNFDPLNIYLKAIVEQTFVSPEDIVWQSTEGQSSSGLSPLLPDLTMSPFGNAPTNDFRYSWMFTGQQADCREGAIFVGDVVVFENRPFAWDANSGTVAGETTVEAIFGYSKSQPAGSTNFYGSQPSRTVVLRWPTSYKNGTVQVPDPDIRVGGWIADVTYERSLANDVKEAVAMSSAVGGGGLFPTTVFPRQRCHWYQIVKKGPAGVDVVDPTSGYRSMTVWVSTPLQALTLMQNGANGPVPVYPNAALVSPHVVNVFTRTFYTR